MFYNYNTNVYYIRIAVCIYRTSIEYSEKKMYNPYSSCVVNFLKKLVQKFKFITTACILF